MRFSAAVCELLKASCSQIVAPTHRPPAYREWLFLKQARHQELSWIIWLFNGLVAMNFATQVFERPTVASSADQPSYEPRVNNKSPVSSREHMPCRTKCSLFLTWLIRIIQTPDISDRDMIAIILLAALWQGASPEAFLGISPCRSPSIALFRMDGPLAIPVNLYCPHKMH